MPCFILPWLSLAKKSRTFDGFLTKSVDKLLALTDFFLLDCVMFCNIWRKGSGRCQDRKKAQWGRKEEREIRKRCNERIREGRGKRSIVTHSVVLPRKFKKLKLTTISENNSEIYVISTDNWRCNYINSFTIFRIMTIVTYLSAAFSKIVWCPEVHIGCVLSAYGMQ